MIGQTAEFAPCDKKFYELRDVTATVDSVPLIAASILSKKLAEGCDALVLDVKTGKGAFMREKKDAEELAGAMVGILKRSGKKAVSLLTNMNAPLGKAVGNSVEVEQTVEILKGREDPGTRDFVELTDILGGWMLFLAGAAKNSKDGKENLRRARLNGSGLKKFREMVETQGGDPGVCDSPRDVLPQAKNVKPVLSLWKGSVTEMDARAVGAASLFLGAGREKKDDSIDHSAGIILYKKLGARVERGEALADFLYTGACDLDAAEKTFLSGIKISKAQPKPEPLVYKVLR
jgi:pyrimidine-nucleoside phosphorylase